MPHTNRKKKSAVGGERKPQPKIIHTKRQQIEDDDGWTHVIDTPRNTQVKVKEGQRLHAGDFEKDGVAYVERTVEELQKDLEYHTKAWESEGGERLLREKLGTREGEVERRRVGDVVCLGLGSLQSARREGRRASFTQLVALRSILEMLDPQFTDLDKDFLTSLGYEVVEDPLAFEQITENSFVYAIHCYAQVYKSIVEGPRPAMMIGTDVDNFGKFNLNETTEGIAKSLENMVKGLRNHRFSSGST